jgi:hypoxanthine phosphoribosyltransferase
VLETRNPILETNISAGVALYGGPYHRRPDSRQAQYPRQGDCSGLRGEVGNGGWYPQWVSDVAFITASSYRGTTTIAGKLEIHDELLPDIAGRHILLLDDILDTGKTLTRVVDHLIARGAASVKVGVLLRKMGRQEVPFEPDFVGFAIPDEFVVGYGLDFNDEYRHLPFIGVLPGGQ